MAQMEPSKLQICREWIQDLLIGLQENKKVRKNEKKRVLFG